MVRRVKLGVLVPSVNSVLEPEFYRMVPEHVSVHFSRLKLKADLRGDLERMIENMDDEIQKLADAGTNVIALGCTGGSLIKGRGCDEKIIKRIERVSGVPATTAATAVIDALNAMRIRQVSLATPYTKWLNDEIIGFIESHGVNVVSTIYLDLVIGMANVPLRKVYKLARSVDTPKSDGIFISCTDFPTVGVITKLEKDLGKPVVSSNQATLWEMLKIAGIKEQRLAKWGSLFNNS